MKYLVAQNFSMKVVLLVIGFIAASATYSFSQFKPGEGFYIIANHIPRKCKPAVDGFYRVSKDGTITLKFNNAQILVNKDIQSIREDLTEQIRPYCREKFPDLTVIADVDLIPESLIEAAVDGVIVTGRVSRPGPIPINEGLTLWQAIQAAGGVTEFASLRFISIVREMKTIDCDLTKIEFMKTPLMAGDIINIASRNYVSEAKY